MKILLIEDDMDLGNGVRIALRDQGMQVVWVRSLEDAARSIEHDSCELVLLDLGLPDGDGLDLLARLRAARLPVLILSARDTLEQRLRGLDGGADDYLVKPFAFDELLARLKALARRRFDDASPRLGAGALTVDTATCLATGPGGAIALSPKEYALLELLLRERGQVLSRTQLFERLYDSASDASDKVVEVIVSTLRGKLARAGAGNPIETRRGFGYCIP